MFYLNKYFNELFKTFNPDILHCFDTDALNSLLILPSTFRYPVILNKCGGPNPLRKNYQHANAIVVFSEENYQWFSDNPYYNRELLFLIPNRVQKLRFLPVEKQKEKKDPKKITFLRVTRIGGAYEKTLLDSFQMIEELVNSFPVRLIVVGRIQDRNRYEWFVKEVAKRKLPVQFITDERAGKGADFLYLADHVIGTGRSFMEAISLGIPTLTPAQNSNWPVLVSHKNFPVFFKTNFSERNRADDITLSENKEEIIKLMKNKTAYKEARETAVFMFKEYFGTDGILKKYNEVYQKTLSGQSKRVRLINKNLPYLLKYYI